MDLVIDILTKIKHQTHVEVNDKDEFNSQVNGIFNTKQNLENTRGLVGIPKGNTVSVKPNIH